MNEIVPFMVYFICR